MGRESVVIVALYLHFTRTRTHNNRFVRVGEVIAVVIVTLTEAFAFALAYQFILRNCTPSLIKFNRSALRVQSNRNRFHGHESWVRNDGRFWRTKPTYSHREIHRIGINTLIAWNFRSFPPQTIRLQFAADGWPSCAANVKWFVGRRW